MYNTSSIFSSTSGNRSRRQAAMKTPPEKQEQKLMMVRHRDLESASWLCRSWENSLRGNMPNTQCIFAEYFGALDGKLDGKCVSKITASMAPIQDTQGPMVAIRAPWERPFGSKVRFSSILTNLNPLGPL